MKRFMIQDIDSINAEGNRIPVVSILKHDYSLMRLEVSQQDGGNSRASSIVGDDGS